MNGQAEPVRVSIRHWVEDGIGVVEIDRPPVNALSHSTRSALLKAVVEADGNPDVNAILILGAGRHFVAGSDLHEFDAAPLEPLLNDVLLRIEACAKPVIAALHGTALGGGFELALACHYRCATDDLSVGLPEISYGLLPGAGGTQRLPRLIDPVVAIDMMLSGKPVGMARALELGIVDERIDAPVRESAQRYAQALVASGAKPKRLRERVISAPTLDAAFFSARAARARLDLPGLLAPGFIVECAQAAVFDRFDNALALSRRRFEECRVSVESRALRHLFFAERHGGSKAKSSDAAQALTRVSVIGAGTMGSGIAVSLAAAGVEVTLIDPQSPALGAGMERVRSTIDTMARRGRLSEAAAASATGRVTSATDLAATATAELVIEAVYEDLSVKREVFAALDKYCQPGTVFATNTSTLDVDAIAAATTRPEFVVGMHFFSPAHVMRLVEVIKASSTKAQVVECAMSLVRRMGKLGVIVGNGFGFVGNKMLYAYGRENQLLLLEGAGPSQIDRALMDFGMAMGPNAVGDLAGLDVGYRVRRARKSFEEDPRYYRVADILVEAGRFGQKSGRGTFKYLPGSREALPDPEVDAMIEAEAARLGVHRRGICDIEIVKRCILALINAGAELLDSGVASSAADIDVIWCNGYGFPRRRGGPMFYADSIGLGTVVAELDELAERWGPRHWTAAKSLRELATLGSTFDAADEARKHV